MQSPRSRTLLRDGAPALLVAGFAVGIWIALRANGPVKGEAFFGWLCLLLLAATVSAIAYAAFATGGKRVISGLLTLCATCVVFSAGAGLVGGYLGVGEVLAVAAICVTWLSLCCAMAWTMRRLGAAAANVVALLVAMLLMASPVVGIPVVRAAASWGTAGTISPWQGRVIEVIREGCPLLAMVDAVRPAMKVDWSHLPGMYAWSGLGQDVPMLLPNAWVSAAVYAGVALVLFGIGFFGHRRALSTQA